MKWFIQSLAASLSCFLLTPTLSYAGVLELTGSYSLSQSSLGSLGFVSSRRIGISVGYYFTETSELEFSGQDILYRTVVSTVEDATFHDQVYSVAWLQSFVPKSTIFQPYLKAGAGQVTREFTGTYAGGSTPVTFSSLAVVMGAGLKIIVLHSLAIRVEGATYLPGAVLSTWKDNFAISGGVSIYL